MMDVERIDSSYVQDFIISTFTREEVALPSSIIFTLRDPTKGPPKMFVDDNKLYVSVASDAELRRLVARYILRHRWSHSNWLLANKPGRYTLASILLILLFSFLCHLIAITFVNLRVPVVATGVVGIIIFAMWAGYQIALRSIPERRRLAKEITELGGMTEFDFKDYVADISLASHGGIGICMVAALASTLLHSEFKFDIIWALLTLTIPLTIGVIYLFSFERHLYDDLCDDGIDWNDEDAEEIADSAYEDSEYLRTSFERVIDDLDIREKLIKYYESEFTEVRARFIPVKYAHCWNFRDYVEDGVLYIDSKNLSLDVALRRGTSILALRTLRFYNELSLRERAAPLPALFFGIAMFLPMFVAPYISILALIIVWILTGVVYTWSWYNGWKNHEEVRRDLPELLRKTGIYDDLQLDFYGKTAFSFSRRDDWIFLIGFQVTLNFIGIVSYLLSGT